VIRLPLIPVGITAFRGKLLVSMMLVIGLLTAIAVYLVQRNATADAEFELQQQFRSELASLDRAEELRHEALAERCRDLVLKPRLHAALEDNALDLLYPSAKDELRDVMQLAGNGNDSDPLALRATFYRFLDIDGALIQPPNPAEVGQLSTTDESQIRLHKLPQTQQIGYIRRQQDDKEVVEEVIALPIFSSETGDVISALLVGFKPFEPQPKGAGMRSGIWVNGRLYLASLSTSAATALSRDLVAQLPNEKTQRNNFTIWLDGQPHLLFFKILNLQSIFPPAYQVCIYPLQNAVARKRRLQAQIIGAGIALLAAGFLASHFASERLSRPVKKLEIESETNLVERRRAEANLVTTSEELKRSARFSANASHQLKSPLSVLRAGIEALLERSDFEPSVYDELSSLLHQTYRLTGVIDDLLLLSRMDAGRLQIDFSSVDLSELVDEWLDDLAALPETMDMQIEKKVPAGLRVAGEKRYTSLIVQNLVENARKYNRPGGRIRVTALQQSDCVSLNIGNTGATIPTEAQGHIFERFHRGGMGENVTGHGLGLNLACELTHLHGGELRLVRSGNDWTEFEVTFRPAPHTQNGARIA
jgi:signal transduction histidine kinase